MTSAARNVEPTVIEQYPRFEGSNILEGIGFKHIMYLSEEAVLQYFRNKGLAPGKLYRDYGLCFEVVESSIRIRRVLRIDDLVRIEVQPEIDRSGQEQAFSIQMFTGATSDKVKSVTGTLKVLFRQRQKEAIKSKPPIEIAPYVVSEIRRLTQQEEHENNLGRGTGILNTNGGIGQGRGVLNADDDIISKVISQKANTFIWKWRIPYFYCHFNKWIQHSGYLRLVEEVVDLFLAEREISIRTMLDTYQWIPVVSHAEVEILREAIMEETIYVVYTVEEIFKNLTYTSKIDFYVVRNSQAIKTATSLITHGYAKLFDDSVDIELAKFDEKTLSALRGKRGVK
jgi:acyl-CoA thioesterase FadM